jgi:hypothetical protein
LKTLAGAPDHLAELIGFSPYSLECNDSTSIRTQKSYGSPAPGGSIAELKETLNKSESDLFGVQSLLCHLQSKLCNASGLSLAACKDGFRLFNQLTGSDLIGQTLPDNSYPSAF